MKAAILNPDMLNLAMLDSAILVFPLKVTHTCQDWFPPFAQNKLHSFSLTQLDDGSQLKFCHVGFIQFAKKKNFNLSFSLNLMMATILNSAILNSAILVFFLKVTHTCQDWFPPFAQKTSLIHSDSTWWWQPSWILSCWFQTLPSWIQTPCYLLSDSLKTHSFHLTLTQTNSIWLKLIQTWWWQPTWILPSWIWLCWLILTS